MILFYMAKDTELYRKTRMTLERLNYVTGHAKWSCALTVLLAPAFHALGIIWFLPIVGLILGIVNELFDGHRWSWFDIADFTFSSIVAASTYWFCLGMVPLWSVLIGYAALGVLLWKGNE